MDAINDGGAAFPTSLSADGPFGGLTKREHFAGLAMQGLLAGGATYGGRTDWREALAADATGHADALVAALATRKTEGA